MWTLLRHPPGSSVVVVVVDYPAVRFAQANGLEASDSVGVVVPAATHQQAAGGAPLQGLNTSTSKPRVAPWAIGVGPFGASDEPRKGAPQWVSMTMRPFSQGCTVGHFRSPEVGVRL